MKQQLLKIKCVVCIAVMLISGITGLLHADETKAQETFTVKKVKREGTIKVVGELHADRKVLIDTQVPGIVMAVYVDIGDKVAAGGKLVTMDNIDLRHQVVSMKNQYDRLIFGFAQFKPFFKQKIAASTNGMLLAAELARIQVDFQKKNFSRMDKLFKEGSIPEGTFDEARTAFQTAENSLRQAENRIQEQISGIHALAREIAIIEERVNLLVIRAPFAGSVVKVLVEVGGKIGAGPDGDLLHLADTTKLVFQAGVPEEYYSAVKKGGTISLEIPGRDSDDTLTVTRVSPVIDPQGRSFLIEADVENKDLELKPGLFCIGYIRIAKEGLAVPSAFVQREEKGDFVKLKNGTSVRVKLISSPKQNEVFISGPQIKERIVIVK